MWFTGFIESLLPNFVAAFLPSNDMVGAVIVFDLFATFYLVRWWSRRFRAQWRTVALPTTFGVMVLACGFYGSILLARMWAPSIHEVPPSAEQIKAMGEVVEFLSGRDETRIREVFDLPNLLRYNILFNARDFGGRDRFSKSMSDEIDAYFKDGQAVIDLRYAKCLSGKKLNPMNHL